MEQKPKLFNINNFITSESGRLTSLSLKRDLSLGGSKQKKTYKPNLNVVRNKNKTKTSINTINRKTQCNKKNSFKHSETRNNQNKRYIQSTSLFSEGTGELKPPKIKSDRYLNYDRDPAAMPMPKVIKTNTEVNYKEEKAVVDDLLDPAEDSTSESEDDYRPVILPLKDNKAGFLKTYIKKEDLDNKELKEEVTNTINNTHRTSDNILHSEVPFSFQDNKFYDDNHPCISLVRLPDCLPGKGFAEDSEKVVDFDLNQMVEGKIGKVLVKKSGKVEVQIGHMKYILDNIESHSFKEDIMYMTEDLKSLNCGPDMVNLGGIDEKYILSPNWKNLFDSKNSKK